MYNKDGDTSLSISVNNNNNNKQNDLVNAGAKLVSNKIGIPTKEQKQKYKSWLGKVAKMTKKLQNQTKALRKKKYTMTQWKENTLKRK